MVVFRCWDFFGYFDQNWRLNPLKSRRSEKSSADSRIFHEMSEVRFFILGQWAAGILFMIIFSPTYFIHDYYGLQWTLMTLLLAQVALLNMKKIRYPLIFLGSIGGLIMAQSATVPQLYYDHAAEALAENTLKIERGLMVTDRAGEATLYLADRPAWLAHLNQWLGEDRNPASLMHEYFEQRLRQSETDWVAVLLVGDQPEQRSPAILDRLANFGWTKIIFARNWPSQNTKEAAASFTLLRRQLRAFVPSETNRFADGN